MQASIAYTDLSAKAGISLSYANEIVNKQRDPSRALAIHILRTTGWRHPTIADLTDDQIEMLEQLEPWAPKTAKVA